MSCCMFCAQNVSPEQVSNSNNCEILSMIDAIYSDWRPWSVKSGRAPIVCAQCLTLLKISYNFKILCEATENKINNFVTKHSLPEGQSLHLAYLLGSGKSHINMGSLQVCRTCLKQVTDNEYLLANGNVVGMQCEIGEMLNVCFTKMNLLLSNDPILCKNCVEMLLMSYAFHSKSLPSVNRCNNIPGISTDPIISNERINMETEVSQFPVNEMNAIKIEHEIDDSNDFTAEINSQSISNEACSEIGNTPIFPNIFFMKQEDNSDTLNEEVKLEDLPDQSRESGKAKGVQVRKPYKPLNRYYFCKTCTYTTKRKACLIKHKVVHLPGYKKTIYQCKQCGYTCKRQKYLDLHMDKHARGVDFNKYKCDLCSFCTRKKCKLERHQTVHKDERETTMYQCSKCMFITKWKEYLAQHELTHNASEEEKKFKCDQCSFSTNWKGSLIQHSVVHLSGEEAFKFHCTECSYKTKRRDNLTKHMIRHMKDEDVRIFYCPECPFTSKFSSKLSRHLHVHKKGDELTIYKCEECPFETRWKNNLSQHMRVHQDVPENDLFKCKECSFTSKWKTCLTEHVVMHKTGEGSKEFKCNICDFNTKWKKSLNMHLLTHSADETIKKFKCNVCDYKTYRSHHLKRHLQVHSK